MVPARWPCLLLLALVVGACSKPARTPTGLEALERQVQEFKLANGLRFVLVERHDAPVFSYQTVVNAGAADNTPGTTGLAHMMEHMAFKGTPWVGTRDHAAETPLLEDEERAYAALTLERIKAGSADTVRLRKLEADFAEVEAALAATVEPDEFTRILERAGARDVNAFTSADVTAYQYSIPSNQLELWAVMEGGRLTHPVFREFYKEREVVIEERRMSTESSPFGRLAEAFTSTAFVKHPYRFGTIGAPQDLHVFSRTQGEAFFRQHYVASNMTIAVVGDVTLADLRRAAQRYFSDIPAGTPPPPVDATEPPQTDARRKVLEDPAQPIVMMGWHMPACTDPSYPAYRALADLLGGGDHARLQKALVRDRRISVSEETTVGFPGEKYPSLWGVLSVPAEGVPPDSVEREVERVIADASGAHPITQAELDGYKVRVRSEQLGDVERNSTLAYELSMAQTLHQDWREYFRTQERVQALTLADLTSAMHTMFTHGNCTTAMLVTPASAKSSRRGR